MRKIHLFILMFVVSIFSFSQGSLSGPGLDGERVCPYRVTNGYTYSFPYEWTAYTSKSITVSITGGEISSDQWSWNSSMNFSIDDDKISSEVFYVRWKNTSDASKINVKGAGTYTSTSTSTSTSVSTSLSESVSVRKYASRSAPAVEVLSVVSSNDGVLSVASNIIEITKEYVGSFQLTAQADDYDGLPAQGYHWYIDGSEMSSTASDYEFEYGTDDLDGTSIQVAAYDSYCYRDYSEEDYDGPKTTYTVNRKDLPEYLSIEDEIEDNKIFKATQLIEFLNSSSVTGSASVLCESGSEIRLNPDFVATSGVELSLKINATAFRSASLEKVSNVISVSETTEVDTDEYDASSFWMEQKFGIVVLPNPSSDGMFSLKTNLGSSIDGRVEVYQITGFMIENKNIVDGQLDLSYLPSGVYVLRVEYAGKTETHKILIDKK